MLEWNVYLEDFNSKKICIFNVFNSYNFYNGCLEAKKKYVKDKEKFLDEIKSWLKYSFWSKCEYEIVLTSWPKRDNFEEEKIDVYDQVMLNWPVFSEYIWENKKELKKKNS